MSERNVAGKIAHRVANVARRIVRGAKRRRTANDSDADLEHALASAVVPPDEEVGPRIEGLTRDAAAKYSERIAQLAAFRGEAFASTLKHVVNFCGVRNVPRGLKPFMLPRNHAFQSIEAEGTLYSTITLANGRVLTCYRTSARLQRYYHCLFDLLPPGITAETYEVYVESYRRYVLAVAGSILPFLPPKNTGGVLVDAGAYIGFKAIGFADYVGPGGRSIMIEIGAENEQLARRNIEQNGLGARVQSFCCGVWSSNGTQPDRVRDRSTHTLAQTDEHDYCTTNLTVTTRTLDSIFAEAGVDRVDLLNLQLNGAEPEGIDGLVEHFDKVRVILAAAPFHHDGVAKKGILADKLRARGCWVKEKATTVLAVTAPYKKMFHVK